MRLRLWTILAGPTLLIVSRAAPLNQMEPRVDLQEDLQKIARLVPEPCSPDPGETVDSSEIYGHFFPDAAQSVAAELDAASSMPRRPLERANDALERLQQLSGAVNSAWPEEARFHFEVLDLAPAIAVKMSIAASATYYVFAVPEQEAGKPNARWREFEPDQDLAHTMRTELELYPLQRGPSGHPRFLADFTLLGCAGSFGGAYEAREWDPAGAGSLTRVISQDSAWGLVVDDPLEGVGKFETEGPVITLPHCWFSAVDTWDNPTLCAVDSYDLSGDKVRFAGRAYNRPDLLAVAKAIEYAQKRDVSALLGYCASSDVANNLVSDLTPDFFALDLQVTPDGDGKERVELGADSVYRFEIAKVADRWLVASFSLAQE